LRSQAEKKGIFRVVDFGEYYREKLGEIGRKYHFRSYREMRLHHVISNSPQKTNTAG